ncbi:hypothetical protein AKJ56_01350 [candidate division MSBL1 archaeon SCGC-AAA382N08]|uniref:ArnR1-like winged helix-turn-helix domain-containing protein n=1 Tax=candidate division MSBL1 archaeon SCGC-AAA382N08 TaxID=1698285 RepID=A0A133VPS8_9EURY|nr:hypothetical protein AKJ56_01350 [candidate division MSBL1 archaeon SCGC-AAA382N08]
MSQSNLDEFCPRLTERELKILKTLKNVRAGLKARQIAGEILPKQHGKGGLSFQSGKEVKPYLQSLRKKGLVDSDGKKPFQWFLTSKGEKILEKGGE